MIARLRFQAGKCTSLEVVMKHNDGTAAHTKSVSVADLAAYDMLSMTDRMILDRLAARVETLAQSIAEAAQ